MSDRVIETIGVGRVTVVPDRLRLVLGVEAKAGSVADAMRTLWRDLDALQRVLDEQGIGTDARQTAALSVYEASNRDGRADGFVASCHVTATTPDPDRAAACLDAVMAVVGDGIRLHGTEWVVTPSPAQIAEARAAAVADALEQARQLAAAAGVALGRVRSLSESPSVGPGPILLRQSAMLAGVPAAEPGQSSHAVAVAVIHDID